MVVIINDNKRASGKTTAANEFLKDKKSLELCHVYKLADRFWNYEEFPEWVLIDPAEQSDIDMAYELQNEIKELKYDIQYSSEKRVEKVPNFILITNQELIVKTKTKHHGTNNQKI